jgi:hypothetical protein
MPQITLGNSDAGDVQLDVLKLVDTRCLIQANSGGGKSWLMRRIAEQTAGQVQVIILDPEGEFVTLREKLDVVIAGKDGDVPCDPRSAGLLARRLLELQTSAVVDLYDLKLHERRRFVRLFLEALIDLPRALWRPCLVMIDEAHMFCPERSAGESEATAAVIGLMAQGRKRGYCGMLATQRLSKLHKDAEAECNNVFIGRTWLDIDQLRAGNLLGVAKTEDRRQLRDLEAGEFFTFGPAIVAAGITRLKVGPVITTHPKSGQRHKLAAPRPSEAIRRVAGELRDLPKQAEEEVKSLAEAKKKIAELQKELKQTTKPIDEKDLQRRIDQATAAARRESAGLEKQLVGKLAQAEKVLRQIAGLAVGTKFEVPQNCPMPPAAAISRETVNPPRKPNPPAAARKAFTHQVNGSAAAEPGDVKLDKCHRAILQVLAEHPEGCTAGKLTLLSGYRFSGGFRNALGDLRKAGYITGGNTGVMAITPEGEACGPFDPLPTGQALIDYWLNHNSFDKCHRAILAALVEQRAGLTAEELCEVTGYQFSGGFRNALGDLRKAGVIEGSNRGTMKASDHLFE